jgi:hypothetical protein
VGIYERKRKREEYENWKIKGMEKDGNKSEVMLEEHIFQESRVLYIVKYRPPPEEISARVIWGKEYDKGKRKKGEK